jgi:plasmid stabilization system protein ParE
LEIIISPIAQWKIEELLNYLETEWSFHAKNKFLNILLRAFDQLAKHPRSSIKSSEFPDLYKKVVTKHTSIYYRIKGDRLEIVDMVDNRQNPDDIYEQIKRIF